MQPPVVVLPPDRLVSCSPRDSGDMRTYRFSINGLEDTLKCWGVVGMKHDPRAIMKQSGQTKASSRGSWALAQLRQAS